MKDFKKFGGGFGDKKRNGGGFGGRDAGRSNFGGKPGFKKFGGDRGFGGPKEMFRATCASCHKSCEVPFRPNGEKPMYCSECFDGQREHDGGRNNFGPRFEKRREERPFEPRRDEKPSHRHDHDAEELKRQISELNRKVDSIIEMLKQQSTSKKDSRAEEIKKIVDVVTKPEKKETKLEKPKKKDTKKKGPIKK